MNSRRQFVKHGALAATALIASRPMKTFAGIGPVIQGSNYNHLVYLHTAKKEFSLLSKTEEYMNEIKTASPAAVLIHTGNTHSSNIAFDVSPAAERENREYSTISKNGLNTGIVFISENENDAVAKVNRLAAMLKNEKDCQLVVCISRLGYKNESSLDDKQLAEASKDVDLIIGGHDTNYTSKTMVCRNSLKQEVVIQSSKNNERNCGKIEFSFDNAGFKKHVHVGTRLYKHVLTA